MTRGSDLTRRILCLSGLAAVLLLTAAASAMGQAAVDQYLPSAKPAAHHGSVASAVRQATGTTPATAQPNQGKKRASPSLVASSKGPGGPSDSGGGGYPLTAFVIIVALLFVAGVATRYLPGLIRRWRPRQLS
jgi:hypothetical protein